MKISSHHNIRVNITCVRTSSYTHIENFDAVQKISIEAISKSPVKVARMERQAFIFKATENPWQNLANSENQHCQPTISKAHKAHKTIKQQSAASAAVQDKTGNFDRRTTAEARPEWGVLKAFLLGHTSACLGA